MRLWLLMALIGAVSLGGCDRTADTEKFLTTAATAGQFEIEASRIAASKATNHDVKAFAEQMISDHEIAAQKLSTAAIESGRMPPQAGMHDRQTRKLEELRTRLRTGLRQALCRAAARSPRGGGCALLRLHECEWRRRTDCPLRARDAPDTRDALEPRSRPQGDAHDLILRELRQRGTAARSKANRRRCRQLRTILA